MQCSLDVRCSECQSWSSDVMLDYLKHRKSLVSKGKKKLVSTATSSSPSVPPAVTTTAPVGSPSLPSMGSDDKLRDYVHSVLATFFSQSGSVGTNPSFSAPLVVPDSAPLLRGITGGLGGGFFYIEVDLPNPLVWCHRCKRKPPPPPPLQCVRAC